MDAQRSKARDGLGNRLEAYALTHFGPLWRLLQAIGPLERRVNHTLIDRGALKMPPRPNPYSCRHPYTSWESLTDKDYSSRHLPPAEQPGDLPEADHVAEALFMRRQDETGEEQTTPCPKSTVLFPSFAQWFTDGFLRSDRSVPRDPAKNDSNHEIDLVQIYGVEEGVTDLLRAGRDGLLRHQRIDGAEFPPYLFEDGAVKEEFRPAGPNSRGIEVARIESVPEDRKARLFAMGSDTANLQIGFVMMNVLFLREHNRIARRLAEHNPSWDDERLFQTARNILTVLLIKIVIEEYINHIAPYHFRFRFDPEAFGNHERWYRENWMAAEFNLLYQWHSLARSSYRVGPQDLPLEATLFNTQSVVDRGLGPLFEDASKQPAGEVRPFNTPRGGAVWQAVVHAIDKARALKLASYNSYREHCGFPRVTDFDQISGDPEVQAVLEDLYGSVERIEFYPGLFAEDRRPDSVLPAMIGRIVGVDAFSQALTNPLLAPRVYNAGTFTPWGMHLIETTGSLGDLLERNVPEQEDEYFVSLTRRDYHR